MTFIKQWAWPVVAGFIVASVVMMAFEYANSFMFPLPTDLDWNDQAAVKALTMSLPWTAFILVLLGWIAGSFAGGWIATRLSGDTQYRSALVLGILLTLAGIANILMLGHPWLFTGISLPMFLIFTYAGHTFRIRA